MSIHTILSQMDSQEFYELMQSYRHMPITEQELTVKAFEDVKQWIKAFATRIVEEAQREERERIKKELKGLDCGFCNYEEEVMERIDSGTKLQKMKGDL